MGTGALYSHSVGQEDGCLCSEGLVLAPLQSSSRLYQPQVLAAPLPSHRLCGMAQGLTQPLQRRRQHLTLQPCPLAQTQLRHPQQ